MVKVSLDLEEDLHKAIRKRAIDKGITMKAYLVELIEKGESMEEDESIAQTKGVKSTDCDYIGQITKGRLDINSSWYIAIQKEVMNIVVAIVTYMTKPINGCANTKAYEIVEGICESEIVRT